MYSDVRDYINLHLDLILALISQIYFDCSLCAQLYHKHAALTSVKKMFLVFFIKQNNFCTCVSNIYWITKTQTFFKFVTYFSQVMLWAHFLHFS